MTHTPASSPATSIRVSECRGGGFAVLLGSEIYAACSGAYEVAEAISAIQAMRADSRQDMPTLLHPPVPAGSGSEPLPAGIRPDAADDVELGSVGSRARAVAGMVLMALIVGVSGVWGV